MIIETITVVDLEQGGKKIYQIERTFWKDKDKNIS